MGYKIKNLVLDALLLSIILITCFPYSKYVFYPVVIISFLYALYFKKNDIRNAITSLKGLLLIILQFVIFLIALTWTGQLYPNLIKEGINVLCIIAISIVFISLINNRQDIEAFYLSFVRIVIYSSSIISLIGILKFMLELKGINLPIYYNNVYPFGSSLIPDYNFFSLISLIGIVFVFYNILEGKIRINNFLQIFALLCLSTSVLLAASRRANIILFALLGIEVLLVIFNHFGKINFLLSDVRKNLSRSLIYFLVPFFLIHSAIILSILFISPESKVAASNKLGLKLSKCQTYSTTILYKLQSVFVIKDYLNTFSKLWHGTFDSRFPESGWGNGDYTIVNNLEAQGLKTLPSDAVGIKLDHFADSYITAMESFYFSYIKRQQLKADEKYLIQIYCYTSSDYDGDQVYLKADLSDSRQKYSGYNLDKKGTWQRLSLNISGDNNLANFFISFKKDSVINFAKLKGYVIFAYPTIDSIKINPDEPKSWATVRYREIDTLKGNNVEIVPEGSKGCLLDSSTSAFSVSTSSYSYVNSYITIGERIVHKGDGVLSEVYCYVAPEYNGNDVMLMTTNGTMNSSYDLSKKGQWQKLSISVEGEGKELPLYLYFTKYGVTDFSSLKGYVIFAHPVYKIIHIEKPGIDEHAFVKLTSSPVMLASLLEVHIFNDQITDSTHFENLKNTFPPSDFNLKFSQDNFAGPRLDHWRFGWHLYKNHYNLKQKIFGGGFDYMSQFGKEFHGDSQRLDWPHNPFVSVVLYSGLVGFIAYFWLLMRAIYIYWQYRRDYWPLFVCFTISYFFSFFSANNPLEPIIIGFLTIIPFVIHFIYQKEKKVAV